MKMIAWLMLAAAIVPFLSAILAKAGGQKFDNNDPRPWLARQEGWRARANAAQSNAFEALPFFYAAVLFALHNQADATRVATLMACWLGLRLGYLAMYVAGWARCARWSGRPASASPSPSCSPASEPAAAPPGASAAGAASFPLEDGACGAGALDGDLAFLRRPL